MQKRFKLWLSVICLISAGISNSIAQEWTTKFWDGAKGCPMIYLIDWKAFCTESRLSINPIDPRNKYIDFGEFDYMDNKFEYQITATNETGLNGTIIYTSNNPLALEVFALNFITSIIEQGGFFCYVPVKDIDNYLIIKIGLPRVRIYVKRNDENGLPETVVVHYFRGRPQRQYIMTDELEKIKDENTVQNFDITNLTPEKYYYYSPKKK